MWWPAGVMCHQPAHVRSSMLNQNDSSTYFFYYFFLFSSCRPPGRLISLLVPSADSRWPPGRSIRKKNKKTNPPKNIWKEKKKKEPGRRSDAQSPESVTSSSRSKGRARALSVYPSWDKMDRRPLSSLLRRSLLVSDLISRLFIETHRPPKKAIKAQKISRGWNAQASRQ